MRIQEQRVPAPAQHSRSDGTFTVLGIRINAVQIPDVIAQIERWIFDHDACHFIAVTGMHGVTEAQHDPEFKNVLNSADLVVPDGMPLVWLGRRHGHRLQRRVYGPELMRSFCRVTGSKYRHFLYGGMPGVPNLLGKVLQEQYSINVAGVYSPPFRKLLKEEEQEIVDRINTAHPDVLWVGLSTPKQEHWIYEHRYQLRTSIAIGVGAAFDLNTGRVKQAPSWMQEHGMEWFFRLLQEPRRLWRRYLIYGPEFVLNVIAEILRLREFE